MLGVPRQRIAQMVDEGKLPATRAGHSIVLARATVAAPASGRERAADFVACQWPGRVPVFGQVRVPGLHGGSVRLKLAPATIPADPPLPAHRSICIMIQISAL